LLDWLWLALFLFILPFAVVPLVGAPFVPTKVRLLIPFLKELGVGKSSNLLDIGSGDGTVLKYAAKTLGANTRGIELNPFLVAISRFRLFRLRHMAQVKYGDMWGYKIPASTDYIYAFVLPKYMPRLEKKITSEIGKKVTVVTYSFEFEGRKPIKQQDGFFAYQFEPLAKK
jgi:SAM-dependent methyltransferase